MAVLELILKSAASDAAKGKVYECDNKASWHPTLHTINMHHHPATAWRKLYPANADTSWYELLPLCGICHDEYHTLANIYVYLGGPPPYVVLRTFSLYVRAKVAAAWVKRPVPKPPYTLPHAA